MSFPSGLTSVSHHIRTFQTKKIIQRKEQDSYITPHTKKISHTIRSEGTSSFTSFRGNITLEAAMAVPLFFLAALCLIWLLEIASIQTAVRSGMQMAGRSLASEVYDRSFLSAGEAEQRIIEMIGTERLDRSIIVGGSGGLHCEKTAFSPRTSQIRITVQYKVRLPVPVFGTLGMSKEDSCLLKGWTGYVKGGFLNNEEEVVYVTETGTVYHKDYQCTHLKLSIRAVTADQIDGLRNDGDGKYYPCEKCARKGHGGRIYITGTGDRYHSSLGCSGLKRTIYAVPVSEAIGRGACTRCSQ